VSETIYSTSTVDTTQAGTTTIDYWATNPATGEVLHAIRGIVITAAANDNTPVTTATSTSIITTTTTAANDNQPTIPLAATGTDATSTH
jgi:DMSO reductase anchor subunit